MIQERLNDAAIALHRILNQANVRFGIFGGYAIGVLGGVRESKDIDCIASISKQQIITLLDKKEGFEAIPQSRQDYVAFFWSDKPDRSNAVLVEIFCEQFAGESRQSERGIGPEQIFQGAQYTMNNIRATIHEINGQRLGSGLASFLDPFHLFKGKLRAAATRSKFHDSFDLRWLADKFEEPIKAQKDELNLQYIGLAIKRYPELGLLFGRLGIDLAEAKNASHDMDPNRLPAPAPGDVQRGLLG
jgi:hypothetical protein